MQKKAEKQVSGRRMVTVVMLNEQRLEIAVEVCKQVIREFKLSVIRQTANARQRKILWYQAIKVNELAVLKLKYIIILSTRENSNLPFPET